jgi:hypothetical protein
MTEKAWKAPATRALYTHCPQLWRLACRRRKALQMKGTGRFERGEKSSLRRLPPAAMLGAPEGERRSGRQAWSGTSR